MLKICICGGGSLGHVCAGVLASQKDVEVNIFTRHPEHWSHRLVVTDREGRVYVGDLGVVSNSPGKALRGCDLVFLCLPGFAIERTLSLIAPHVNGAVVGSVVCSTGFFFFAHRLLPEHVGLLGFQRVPFIARTDVYGHSARLLGYKPEVSVAMERIADPVLWLQRIEKLWLTPVKLLHSFYEASLTNSNPILHTGRLYDLWKDWKGEVYGHNILFYKEWTDSASEVLIDMDAEFMRLLDVLPVEKGSLLPLLEYYESQDAASLTRKIRSIQAFEGILSPMKEVEGGWVPDFSSRYFTEDFPYGLRFIVELSRQHRVEAPTLHRVYEWGMSKLGQFPGSDPFRF